jgi:hypothetical protein
LIWLPTLALLIAILLADVLSPTAPPPYPRQQLNRIPKKILDEEPEQTPCEVERFKDGPVLVDPLLDKLVLEPAEELECYEGCGRRRGALDRGEGAFLSLLSPSPGRERQQNRTARSRMRELQRRRRRGHPSRSRSSQTGEGQNIRRCCYEGCGRRRGALDRGEGAFLSLLSPSPGREICVNFNDGGGAGTRVDRVPRRRGKGRT